MTSQAKASTVFWRAPASGLTALILAGSRGGASDPLAVYAGVSHKALIEVDGTPMIERVIAAVAAVHGISRIVISIELPELIAGLPGLQAAANGIPIELLKSAASPSRSVAAALDHCGTPLLVTTADHALLQAEWLRYFLDHIPANADAAVALANKAAILEAVPDTARTYLRFADDHYSGCNLFLFATPAAAGAVRFWREVEAERKRPWRMLRRLGLVFALRYAIGQLPLSAAITRLGELSGTLAAVVKIPFGRAAVDVDKPTDLDLVQRLLTQDRLKNRA